MTNKRPLLSIVIPTKDRYYYLKKLIELIDSFHSDEIELVLQDNTADNTEILEFLKLKDYPYIKYTHNSEQIPISLNSDLAILNSTGEYVCFIGDDDGVTRYIVDCVKWMKKNDVDAVFAKNVHYSWGNKAKLIKKRRLFIKHDPCKEINILLKKGLILSESNVPLLYHGIVKRSIINEIYSKFDTIFLSSPPDISSAITLSYFVKKYYEVNIPIIINGSSNETGGGVIKKGGVLALKDIDFVSENDKKIWEKSIPPIWCGHYAWANSGLQTIRKYSVDKSLYKFNLEYCLAAAISTRPTKKILIKYAYKYSDNVLKLSFYISYLILRKYIRKIVNNNILTVKQIDNVKDIIEAEQYFVENSTNHFNK